MQKFKEKLIVILGPTASGKTELALKLAKKLALSKIEGFNGVEIVSADSRQIYKEMDIGTGKITKKEMKGVPHHLIDEIKPNQEFNVAIYKKMAIEKIKDIQKRKKIPFLVGGTGLYIQAVVDNIEFPEVPPQKNLRKKLEKKSAKELFEIYKKLDPEGSKFIEKENKRRLVRAIEVCKVTGKSFWQQRRKKKPLFDVLQIGIKLPKKELKKKIEKRVEKMFRVGLEKEIKNLVKKYGWIPTLQTIGYQEWSSCVKTSEDKQDYIFSISQKEREKIKAEIKTHTLQFAKRQMTWFKRDKRVFWIKNYKETKELMKKVSK